MSSRGSSVFFYLTNLGKILTGGYVAICRNMSQLPPGFSPKTWLYSMLSERGCLRSRRQAEQADGDLGLSESKSPRDQMLKTRYSKIFINQHIIIFKHIQNGILLGLQASSKSSIEIQRAHDVSRICHKSSSVAFWSLREELLSSY